MVFIFIEIVMITIAFLLHTYSLSRIQQPLFCLTILRSFTDILQRQALVVSRGHPLAKLEVCVSSLFQEGQLPDFTEAKGLSELKATLKDIVQSFTAAGGSRQFLPYTTSYLVFLDPSTGLQWGKMTQEQSLHKCNYLQKEEIETLTTELLKKVQMS